MKSTHGCAAAAEPQLPTKTLGGFVSAVSFQLYSDVKPGDCFWHMKTWSLNQTKCVDIHNCTGCTQ